MKSALNVLLLLCCTITFSQVGINTNSPAPDAALDIDGTDKGVLIPRVDIDDLSTIAPVTGGSTESLLVYNTNTTTGKGFYFWSGLEWVPVGKGLYWEKNGNTGTVPGTGAGQNFLGTKDAQDLVIATNNNEAMRVTSNGQIQAIQVGTPTSPTYSFSDDTDTGIYSSEADRLSLSAGGTNLLEIDGGSNAQITLNNTNGNYDTRIASLNESHMLFVDANTNRVGIAQNNPQSTLHIGGSSSTMRIDALNSINNANNQGSVSTPVFVDSNGSLNIQGSNVITQLAHDIPDFLSTGVVVDNTTGTRTLQLLHSEDVTLTRDALIEVVYQVGVLITDTSDNYINDGRPRIYRIFVEIDDSTTGTPTYKKIAYKGDAYTCRTTNTTNIVNGPFFLNGNGYVRLTGTTAGSTHTIRVYAEVFGNTASTRCVFGGNGNDDLLQILVRY